MSGHRRVCVTTFFLFAGLAVSPASSNSLADWINNPALEEAKAPAQAECVAHLGKSTAPGRHWMYHQDGHRKCWFEGHVTYPVQRRTHHHAPKRPDENEATLRKMGAMNARDQLLTAPPTQVSASPPAPDVIDTAIVPSGGPATLASAAPLPLQRKAEQLTTNPRLADMISAVATLDKDGTVSSTPQAVAAAPAVPDASTDRWRSMATRLGMAAVALGLVLLLGSLLSGRFLYAGRA